MPVPYVNSGFKRIENDNYQTIDPRCIHGLVAKWFIEGDIIDCCAPNGSGIVSELQRLGRNARGVTDAFSFEPADWIITNPPYDRNIVDRIINHQLGRLKAGNVKGVAALMRANWDFTASRAYMFDSDWYAGQIRMRFRPWWSEERDAQPIHNFVWHIWQANEYEPVVRYWTPKKG